MTTLRPRTLAAIALGLAGLLALAGLGSLSEPETATPIPSVASAAVPPATMALPRQGDCGRREVAGVVPAPCDAPASDVEVARVHLGGDPVQRCPLFRPDAVLFTSVTQELYVCWVPRGGGPRRSLEGPASAITAVTAPAVSVGMCGLIHDDHVHHPVECSDPSVNAVADRVLTAEHGACPAGTAREEILPDGARVCWSAA